jgi:hypothetical protein
MCEELECPYKKVRQLAGTAILNVPSAGSVGASTNLEETTGENNPRKTSTENKAKSWRNEEGAGSITPTS